MKKTVLLTGYPGQDATIFIDLFHEKYVIHAIIQYGQKFTINERNQKVRVYYGDITDSAFVNSTINKIKPDFIYNFAAFTHVGHSFNNPLYVFHVNTIGYLNILECVRNNEELRKHTRIYQASTSEMFGTHPYPLKETSLMTPHSPYAISKLASHHLSKLYKKAYGMFVVSGILFNHESKYREDQFLTKKVINYYKEYKKSTLQLPLLLGELDSKRDWGYGPYFVEMIEKMMRLKKPQDFVLGTGISYTVRQFIERVFKDYKIEWKDDKGYINNELCFMSDERFKRPSELKTLTADPRKAMNKLGFEPKKYNLDDIIQNMLED